MSPCKVISFFFFKEMSAIIACVCADGNDPRADIGNAGRQITRGAFLGNI